MVLTEKPQDFKKKFDVVSCFMQCQGKILLLHRQDTRPQGNTWGVPAGKVETGEDLADALVREIGEEIGFGASKENLVYFKEYLIRYPTFDFVYHVFTLDLVEMPELSLNREEHKDLRWLTPEEALKLNLIEDEDVCIKEVYKA